jgi:tellurium resistance protein TerD
MAINVRKGERIDLTKTNPGLTKILIGLGWDVNHYDTGHPFDLDVSVAGLDANGKLVNEKEFVFFNNPSNPNGSIKHTGDNRTGEGSGDDEQIYIDLANVPETIQRIEIAVTIYEAEQRDQRFGQVRNAYARVLNQETNEELIYYDLGEGYSRETALVVAAVYRYNGEWKFEAVGAGFEGGLEALVKQYGA